MTTIHEALYGKQPTQLQRRFYEAFTKYQLRGFAEDSMDPERYEAVFAIAVLQARDTTDKVYVFMPPSFVSWATEQTKTLARIALRNMPNRDERLKVKASIERLVFASRIFQIHEAPSRWVMFGVKEPVPTWARDLLLLENGK